MKFAVEKHWDKIAAGFAINEGGDVALKDSKVQYVGLQASEKVAVNVNVIATGTSGTPRCRGKTIRWRISPPRSPRSPLTKLPRNSIPSRARISKASRRCKKKRPANGYARWNHRTAGSMPQRWSPTQIPLGTR